MSCSSGAATIEFCKHRFYEFLWRAERANAFAIVCLPLVGRKSFWAAFFSVSLIPVALVSTYIWLESEAADLQITCSLFNSVNVWIVLLLWHWHKLRWIWWFDKLVLFILFESPVHYVTSKKWANSAVLWGGLVTFCWQVLSSHRLY